MSQSRNNNNDLIIKYNSLKEEIEHLVQSTSELTKESASQAHSIWREVNNVSTDGAETDELLLSVQVNDCVANFFNNTYPKLEVSETLTTDLYITKLKESVDRLGWQESLKPFDFLRDTIAFQTLNNRKCPREINVPNKERRQRVKNRADTAEATQPIEVTTDEAAIQNFHIENFDQELLRIYQNTMRPVEFWSFVLDPSFETTVERMFYINNLVNDNKVKLLTDNGGEKYLKPVRPSKRNQAVDPKTKVQIFISISPDEHIERLKNLRLN